MELFSPLTTYSVHMGLFNPLLDRVKTLRRLSPRNLKRLSGARLSELIEKEATRPG